MSEKATSDKAFRSVVLAGFVLACFMFAAGYAYLAVRGYRSFASSGAADDASLRRGIALEPRNASAYNAYCRFRRDHDMDFAAALPYCRRAVELNRNDSANWLDLAEVLYVAGDARGEQEALHQAIAVDPRTPEVAWNAANLYLLQGQTGPALDLYEVAMKDPALIPLALKTSWRALGQVQPIVERLPPEPLPYLEFVALLASQDKREQAAQVWAKLMQLDREIDCKEALFYVDDLLGWREVAQAQDAWKQLAERSPRLRRYQRTSDELVINGSFEQELLNSGFDWRLAPLGTKLAIDEDVYKSGGRSMQVTYSSPVLDSGLFQLVPVQPATSYKLNAWLKTEDLQTANGPSLTVTEAYSGALLGSSHPVAYTTPWKQVTVQFTTGPETQMVAIRLVRERQDTVIRGRLWIDDITLTQTQ